jgi:3-phenylpropionate/trans-cinnamate dioxygenase ferredoxin reductase subunit
MRMAEDAWRGGTAPRRIVIVGGSIAAVETATTLRRLGFDGDVTMLSDEQHAPYLRVPLSKAVLAGTAAPESTTIAAPGEDVVLRLGARAVGLDLAARLVHLADAAPVPFDKLVVATGARARRLLGPDAPAEQVLRSLDDCLTLRKRLSQAQSVLMVGGGFLGMEVASTCLDLGKDVTIVDREPPLVRLVGPLLAAHLTNAASAQGARIVVSPKDVALRVEHRRPEVRLDDGRRLTADLVVSAVGDIPNTEWLAGSPLAVHGGLLVDSRCRAGADVVAAGDVTAMRGPGGVRRMPHWTNALEQARAAAATLLYGDDAPPYTPSPYYWTEQFGVSLRLCGRTPPRGTLRELETHTDGSPALLSWSDHDDLTTTVAALNHRAPVGRLKRLLHTENAA